LAGQLAKKLEPGHWVLLEGPLGAGKSTFARYMIEVLRDTTHSEGSPTFALAHEYEGKNGTRIIHMDLYRIENSAELEGSGVLAYFWENPDNLIFSEWTSNWPELKQALIEDLQHPLWLVQIDFSEFDQTKRQVHIKQRTKSLP